MAKVERPYRVIHVIEISSHATQEAAERAVKRSKLQEGSLVIIKVPPPVAAPKTSAKKTAKKAVKRK